MRRLLVITALLAAVMQTLVMFCVPAARAAGLSPVAAGATLAVASATAAVARLLWGRVADSAGGSRRDTALAGAGCVAAAGAGLFALGLHVGEGPALGAISVFAFGGMGWNAVAILRAGELAPGELVGRTVAVQATLMWLIGAAAAPFLGLLVEAAGWDALWICAAAMAAGGSLVASSSHLRPAWSGAAR
jgi:MFS family permease